MMNHDLIENTIGSYWGTISFEKNRLMTQRSKKKHDVLLKSAKFQGVCQKPSHQQTKGATCWIVDACHPDLSN
jgi:hypothetical protein